MIDFKMGVVLGPLLRKDLETYRTWRNQYAVWKYCRQNDVISEIDQETWFERQNADPRIKMYAVYVGDEDLKAVGVCGLTSIEPVNRTAEFSLYIAPDKRGNKYGEKALRTLLSHGFMNLGLNSIWGESFHGNPAIKIFEEIGFVKEGTRRQFYFRSGKFIDAHLYSILREEWECSTLPLLSRS